MTRKTPKARAVRKTGSVIAMQGVKGVWYRLKFDQPTGTRGERKTVWKSVNGVTAEEAEAELARLVGQSGRGVDLDGGKQLVTTWVETWLEHHASPEVNADISQRTFERYAQILRGHVVSEIGQHRLDVLSTLHIERLYNKMAKTLAPRTVRHTHRVLSACLKDAKRFKIIPDNPASDVKQRRIKKKGGDGAAEMHVLPLDRMLALFDMVRAANLKSVPHPLAVLAFDSGARRGELLAARRCDLDLDKRTLKIERSVDETEAYGVRIKDEPKNESSCRTVALSVQTIATLRAWMRKQDEDMLKLGGRLPADALIFPLSIETPATPLRPREVTKAFGRLVKREGFAPFRFHDFRHSCASHLLSRGVPVPEVSRHLGHSSPAITMQIYAHAIPKREGGLGLLDQLMPVAMAAE